MKNTVLAVVLGGIVLLVWQFASWMILPFHTMALTPMPGGAAVAEALKENVSEKGVYQYPGMIEDEEEMYRLQEEGPLVGMMLYYPDGAVPNMPKQSAIGLILNFITLCIVVTLMKKGIEEMPRYGQRLGFMLLVSMLPVFYIEFMQLNWWGMPFGFVFANMIDHIAGFVLAGLAVAYFIDPKKV